MKIKLRRTKEDSDKLILDSYMPHRALPALNQRDRRRLFHSKTFYIVLTLRLSRTNIMASVQKAKEPKEETMNYVEISKMLKTLKSADKAIVFKMDVVSALENNIDCSAYDDEGFEEVCNRFEKALMEIGDWKDLDEIAYLAQNYVDNGEFEFLTVDCFKQAIINA